MQAGVQEGFSDVLVAARGAAGAQVAFPLVDVDSQGVFDTLIPSGDGDLLIPYRGGGAVALQRHIATSGPLRSGANVIAIRPANYVRGEGAVCYRRGHRGARDQRIVYADTQYAASQFDVGEIVHREDEGDQPRGVVALSRV